MQSLKSMVGGMALSLLAIQARASVEFEDPGCYQMRGRVEATGKRTVTLLSYAKTQSETKYVVTLDEKPTGLERGMVISLPALVRPTAKTPALSAKVASIRLLSPSEAKRSFVPSWLGEAGTSGCPR